MAAPTAPTDRVWAAYAKSFNLRVLLVNLGACHCEQAIAWCIRNPLSYLKHSSNRKKPTSKRGS
jgi:hypothetical protein